MRYVLNTFIAVLSLMLIQPVLAKHKYGAALNRVMYQTFSEQWVKTDSAKVIVAVDANLPETGVNKLRQSIVAKLNKVSDAATWHIVSFNSQRDSSGLEKISAIAEARLPNSALAGLRAKAKSISSAGETYKISRLDFTPSPKEFEATKSQLRHEIYNKINEELTQLNKTYPGMNYSVHLINFGVPMSMPRTTGALQMNVLAEKASAATGLSVSQLVNLNATVILASNMKDDTKGSTAFEHAHADSTQ